MHPTTHSSLHLYTLHLPTYPFIICSFTFPSIHSSVIYSSSFFLFNHLTNHHSSSIHLSIHPSVHSNIPPSAHPKVHHLFILPVSTHYLSIHLSIHPCLHLSNFRSSCLFNLPFIHTSFHPLFHLFIYPPTHLFINLFSLHTYNPSSSFHCVSIHPHIHSPTHPRIHPFFHLPATCPSIHASLYPYVLNTHKSIQPSTPVHLPTHSLILHPSIHSLFHVLFHSLPI